MTVVRVLFHLAVTALLFAAVLVILAVTTELGSPWIFVPLAVAFLFLCYVVYRVVGRSST